MAVGSKDQLVKLSQENNEISNSIIINKKANNEYIKVKQKKIRPNIRAL